MSTREYALIAAALFPALVLAIYVFKKDRVEKEPAGLLLKLLVFGVFSCFAVLAVSSVVSPVIETIFSIKERTTENGLMMTTEMYYLYQFVNCFIGIALIEEGCKMAFLCIGTRKDKNFNHLFDGIIYAVFVSLGFAAFENVFYVLENGFGNAVMRALLAVPGHAFYGVMMGCYYSFWHITDEAKVLEKSLMANKLIAPGSSRFSSDKLKVMTLLIPTLAHGLYDFCCFVGASWAVLLLYGFVIFMYIYCFGKIKSFSKADVSSKAYATALVIRKYPHLKAVLENVAAQPSPEVEIPEEHI